ncbi:MAG TPA: hypothetical protein VKT82_09055 [Ktedonobacterales bacterium]|nr:hypothetical protein [Ktedonobacterales bacterium]
MSFDPYAFDLSHAAKPSPPNAAIDLDDELLAVPAEAQRCICRALMQAIEGALDLEDRTPTGHRSPPPVFTVQHAGKPRFNPDDLRQQTLQGWHRLVAIELRLAVLALEALHCLPEDRTYQDLLAEQCARVGQLYAELKRRAGSGFALHILRWELRLLRYRDSPIINALLFPAAGR